MARRASRTGLWSRSASPRDTCSEGLQRRGFTIVELLIVIVVIAILAAITIVAYNGIQNQAKAAAAQAAAKQALTKIQTYAVQNADQYPSDLTAAGLSNSGDTSYQYRVDNSASPKTFCLTATTEDRSYFVSTTTGRPMAGACDGHAVDGGALITNLATNPSFSTGSTGWSAYSSSIGRVTSPWSADGNGSLRITAVGQDSFASTSFPANAGESCTVTGVIRIEAPQTGSMAGTTQQRSIFLSFLNASNTHLGTGGTDPATAMAPNSAGVYELRATGTAPVGTERLSVRLYNGATSGSVYWDQIMVAEGATHHSYADGGSPGWIWNGSPNNSTSTGPLL
ncbi:prepilin-type N-terminal cleavage/methylation domain-containing protein [Microbacterium sp. LRZ72]|uniref:type IV pilin protein n=1 Tax=Microbacterium sp. LRZ72 TaxID=2942481 RepID=UPI0029B7AA0F|nr:prepilin-type N-terminal cleavage/methylation domain-containing protein [Microbacterium sp. LRZ72]MDX2375631.1 prepilin-type N-terminal cleavage/methylation domain-containing protein [Microbacterium sp. LRZ72]